MVVADKAALRQKAVRPAPAKADQTPFALTFRGFGDKSSPPASVGPNGALRAAHPSGKRRVMPKMKTNKSAKKRFRVSGSGRVRRSKAGGNHLMQEKSRKRIRR